MKTEIEKITKEMKKNTILKKCWIWNETVTNFVKDKLKGIL